MSTDSSRDVRVPPIDLSPVPRERLAEVPGKLGQIARERAEDYSRETIERLDRSVRLTDMTGRGNGPAARTNIDRRAVFVETLKRLPSQEDGRTRLNVIAEVKRSSPSQGAIAQLDPVDAARQYVAGGAAALSVLTEGRHFGGELAHLAEVTADRADWDRYVPVLRKDFTVHPAQLIEAHAAGADAVLLIVAVLGPDTKRFLEAARELGLAALVEIHDEDELNVALDAGAEVIGVNNRDLRSLEVDMRTAPRLIATARAADYEGVLVAESGYRTRDDLREVEETADAVLVGTSLAGSGDLRGALLELRGAR